MSTVWHCKADISIMYIITTASLVWLENDAIINYRCTEYMYWRGVHFFLPCSSSYCDIVSVAFDGNKTDRKLADVVSTRCYEVTWDWTRKRWLPDDKAVQPVLDNLGAIMVKKWPLPLPNNVNIFPFGCGTNEKLISFWTSPIYPKRPAWQLELWSSAYLEARW